MAMSIYTTPLNPSPGTFVNKSDYTISVWDSPAATQKIGFIYPREVFGAKRRSYPSEYIWDVIFRDESGNRISTNAVIIADTSVTTWQWDRVFTPIFYMGYSIGWLQDGEEPGNPWITFSALYLRRDTPLTSEAGAQLAVLPAGSRVLYERFSVGYADWDMIKVIGYEDGVGSGNYRWISDGLGNFHGYIMMGLDIGSLPDDIPVYGNW